MTYEKFLDEYKSRRAHWQKVCKFIFVLFLASSILIYKLLMPQVLVFIEAQSTIGEIALHLGIFVLVVVFCIIVFEVVLNLAEMLLEKSYLRPYVVVDDSGSKFVYGFIRDADRTNFQLKLQKLYPDYELDLDLALERRCSFAMTLRGVQKESELNMHRDGGAFDHDG
ncbi:hypothetical protein F7U66_00620 [Vibrio parahaemolyticus]|nr:hypothetical protein [Vibrio parahaemolyticus]